MIAAVIPAAGTGSRTGLAQNKLLTPLGGEPVILRTARTFLSHPRIDLVCAAVREEEKETMRALLGDRVTLVRGGETRGASVLAALEALKGQADTVLIHDGARPFADADTISRVIAGIAPGRGCVAGVPVTDTLKEVKEDGSIASSPDRARFWAAQTPQGFLLAEILAAYRACGTAFTDDAAAFEAWGGKVLMTKGSYRNKKITTREDFMMPPDRFTGIGYDAHCLKTGRKLILGGVDVPYEKGLDGHSDADVLVHAVMDALLGAAGMGDIGQHFPDTDPHYAGASSLHLLEAVCEKLRAAGYTPWHISAIVIAQKPKLAPYMAAMRTRIAETVHLPEERVNVAATTPEHLGFAGRGEGIAAQATATVERQYHG
ncbi:MAG: 2-C-methyl-D-erythritol 2,4-cyclodiphosphate synthase [Clostridia bacterium]|nr:2-C-methyl-D-erythritol 2,4-cyclodiphosphate synthase [Clostridia bacterium]